MTAPTDISVAPFSDAPSVSVLKFAGEPSGFILALEFPPGALGDLRPRARKEDGTRNVRGKQPIDAIREALGPKGAAIIGPYVTHVTLLSETFVRDRLARRKRE